MRLSGARALWLLSALLAAGLVAEAMPGGKRSPAAPPAAPAGTPQAAAAAAEPLTEWVATVLSRPLFAADRRPAAPTANATASTGPQALPRLAGIVVSPTGRSAIFAGDHSMVVAEGAAVGPWRVVAIRADAVDVSGPQGERTVKPTYSNEPPPTTAAAPAPPIPGMPGFAPFNPQNAGLAALRAQAAANAQTRP